MAMFECPGCKSIVDDSIKKCPKCNYDIKKYVKSMGKIKKGGAKADEGVSFNLSSAYSAKTPPVGMPTLDFLSKPAAPAEPAPEPAMIQTPMPEKINNSMEVSPVAPVAPVAPAAPASSVPMGSTPFSVEAPAPVVEAPAPAAAPAQSGFQFTVENKAPMVETASDKAQEVVSGFTDYSNVSVSSIASASSKVESTDNSDSNSMYNDPSYIAPIAPASVPVPQAYTAEGTVQMPSYDVSGVKTVQISAPAKAAPERRPVTPNGPIVPPAPVYEDTVQPTVTLAPNRPAPVPEVSPSTPVISVTDAGYVKLNQKPEEMPVFDSPVLNAAQANNVRPAQPASAASLSSQQLNSATFGASPLTSQAAPLPSFRSANVNTVSAPGMPTAPAQPEVQGIFDSPLLNAQAQKIASGEYVPTSRASDASIAAMQQRKMAPPPPGMGISRQVFGQSGYGQSSGYKSPSQPLVYQEQGPVNQGASQQYQPQYQAAPQYQSGTAGVGAPVVGAPNPVLGAATSAPAQQATPFSPIYGSFNDSNGANGSNVNIPNSGNAVPGGANPLLAGNPLLVNNR